MNNDTFYYLMLFIYDDYSKIKSLNKKINNKIRECLISQHKPIITGFIEQYKSILEITSVRYQSIIQNDNNKVVPLFDLIITAKIKPSKQYYISHILGYNYRHIFSMKNNEYLNQFQFDIRPRSRFLPPRRICRAAPFLASRTCTTLPRSRWTLRACIF